MKLVRKGVHPTPVTLAIGDGANDVPMLQQAQVRSITVYQLIIVGDQITICVTGRHRYYWQGGDAGS